MSNTSTELSEDIEVIGPGQMLAEARVAMGLSQQQVAEQLNFRPALVNEIEQEIFDSKLPDTFNRGYLKNYAKLVGVDEQDVLASYEMLGVAAKQRTELQSFSKITEKEAQHSRLMWISYLILAALIASTVLYYLQDASNNALTIEPQPTNSDSSKTQNTNQAAGLTADNQNPESTTLEPAATEPKASNNQLVSKVAEPVNEELAPETPLTVPQATVQPSVQAKPIELAQANAEVAQAPIAEPVKVVFSFAGDCWVNIYDGAGERIAWGIKKAGYVMELNGVAPFKVTVGKPELVAIDFNGESIDMSKYNVGNIAKFTLPESS
ncbi:RodZ domain-containing protein [Thalassotalea montiporae]